MNDLSAGLILRLVFIWFCCSSECDALAAAHFVKYLQVEANEGNSSGGHTAIRFDKETFHFQHETSGIIRLQRLDSPAFDHTYAVLGNRGIRESWIEVSEDTYALLLDGFSKFLLIQDEQLGILDSLRRDVILFELLLERIQTGSTSIHSRSLPLKGLGYFMPADLKSADVDSDLRIRPSSQALSHLKFLVSSRYGDSFVEQRISEALATIRNLKLRAAPSRSQGLSADLYPAYTAIASETYSDALLALAALQLLQAEPDLLPGSHWSSSSDSFKLSPAESLFLRAFAEKLTSDLLLLVNSSRSDWGFPFIVGMARLASIDASLNSGCMVFLDVFQEIAMQSSQPAFSGLQYLPAMKREAETLFILKRQEFFNGPEMREADFAALEILGNKLMDLEHSLANDVQPRQLPENPVPSRAAALTELLLPDIDETVLQQQLEEARKAEKEYAKVLASLYEYDLFQRNCVTEIFSCLNKSLARLSATYEKAEQSAAVNLSQRTRAESLQRLGGYIDPLRGLSFIPVMSAREVDACYRVTVKHELPSYRSVQLAEMKKRESSLLVFLRESNTITSTIYRRAPNDSPFLFFTEDTFLLRPVYGAFNLLAGLGESLVGLLTLPVEGPNRLYLGAKGILFSLPELMFINLRKGTMEYVAEIR